MDAAMFQTAVTAAVTAAMAQMSNNRSGGGTNNFTNGQSQGRSGVCTYKDYTNGKPIPFYGTGGVMALSQWIEKTEAVFEICTCPEESKVKFAAFTFSKRALTWWNGHVKALTLVVANSMGWENLKRMLLREYCPRGEIQKLEQELWGLTMVGSDIAGYTNRFGDLIILCPGMLILESQKVERYIWGLSAQLRGSVLASKPMNFDSAKELAQSLIDHGVCQEVTTIVTEPTKGNNNNDNNANNNSKKKFWNKRKGQTSQEPSRKQMVTVHAATAPTTTPATPAPTKQYAGNLPKCNKCNYHHHGNYREMHCKNCDRKGHTARFCKALARPVTQVPGTGISQVCYGCGETGHFKRDCRKTRNVGGVGRVLAIGQNEAIADPTVVTSTFLLDNIYACILRCGEKFCES
ncbi:hypothetical protein Lser_V15G04828 [Lactuca serriola]